MSTASWLPPQLENSAREARNATSSAAELRSQIRRYFATGVVSSLSAVSTTNRASSLPIGILR